MDSAYLYHWVTSDALVEALLPLQRGNQPPAVTDDDVRRQLIPVPAIETQVRIGARIDELFAEIDDGEEQLRRARRELKTYRKSLLRAAVTGELTADWRAANSPCRSGEDLVREILVTRGAREEARKRKIDANLDTRTLRPLPNEWTWTRVDIAGDVLLGRQRAPVHHSGEHMRPYLRVANVLEGRLDLDDVKQMNFTPTEFERFALRTGDVLLNEGQAPELLGRPALYRGEINGCCFQKTLLRFRPETGIEPEYALLVFRHYMHSGRFLRENRITTNIGHLTQVRFCPMEFPVPPHEEQVQIVNLVSAMESEAVSLLEHVESPADLRQAILRAAFRGELIQ